METDGPVLMESPSLQSCAIENIELSLDTFTLDDPPDEKNYKSANDKAVKAQNVQLEPVNLISTNDEKHAAPLQQYYDQSIQLSKSRSPDSNNPLVSANLMGQRPIRQSANSLHQPYSIGDVGHDYYSINSNASFNYQNSEFDHSYDHYFSSGNHHSSGLDSSSLSYETGSVTSSVQNIRNIPYSSLAAYRKAVEETDDPKFIFDFVKFLVDIADKYTKNNSDRKKIKRNRILLQNEALKWIKGLVGSSSGVVKGYSEAQFLLAEWYGSGSLGIFFRI